jgi:hypothetical protein
MPLDMSVANVIFKRDSVAACSMIEVQSQPNQFLDEAENLGVGFA